MSSNRIIPDFTEDLVSLMVQMMLTIARFPRAPFALIPLSKKRERYLGADVKIESLAPLYIQFKRSFAYPDSSKAKYLADRKKLGLENSPQVLYFELRNKRTGHSDYQHNILAKLRERLQKRGVGNAVYVAPLFLSRTAYLLSVHYSSLVRWIFWHLFGVDPFPTTSMNVVGPSGSIRFHNIPLLREHIAIPPQGRVSSHKHRYSYLESGGQVCFHSPEQVEGAYTLGQSLYNWMGFREGVPSAKLVDYERSLDLLAELRGEIPTEALRNDKLSIWERWVEFGEQLREEHEIEQYVLVKYSHT
ncbi:MAG: hypothetical protein H7A06_10615 [Pseudomonadales bacterium]|nr:hypothetical protein [Pseudomonadales bacterium]